MESKKMPTLEDIIFMRGLFKNISTEPYKTCKRCKKTKHIKEFRYKNTDFRAKDNLSKGSEIVR